MVMVSEAQKVIELLKGNDGDSNLDLYVGDILGATGFSLDWTMDEIDLMTDAAEQNTTIKELQLPQPEILTDLTVVPFLKLIENSSTLEEIDIGFPRGIIPASRSRKKHRQMIIDMIYHAMLRNKDSRLRLLRVSGIADNHQLLHRFLKSSKIETLWIWNHNPISSESAWALAASLRDLGTLKQINFGFDCNSQTSLSHIITSLHNHPMIEKFHWEGELQYGSFCGILTLCSSCPKIRDVDIRHCSRTHSRADYDIAPLLHGLRFSETLESLSLSGVLIGNVGTIFPSRSNKTIQSLELAKATFQDNSLSFLDHFTGLKKISFSCCTGVFTGIHRYLATLVELEELKFDFDDDDEEKRCFIANISEIVSQSPPNTYFRHSCPEKTMQMVQSIVSGLQSRSKPMKELHFGDSQWEQGALNLFCTNALPFLLDIEELTIGDYPNDTKDQQVEAHNFIQGLSALTKLKTLNFYFTVRYLGTAKAVIKFLETHYAIEQIDGLYYSDDLPPFYWDQVNIFTRWNRCGRRLIHDPNIPLGLWPLVLAKVANVDDEDHADHDVVYEFVKSLNTRVNLFKKS